MIRLGIILPGIREPRLELFINLLTKAIERAKRSDTEYKMLECPPGLPKAHDTVVDYFVNILEARSICETIIKAAKEEKCDAAIIVEADDTGLKPARSLVDIPVIGEFESTIHVANMLGQTFGVVAWPDPSYVARCYNHIRTYGLEPNLVPGGVIPLPMSERDVVIKGFTDPKGAGAPKILEAAKSLVVEKGAEVIAISSTGLSCIAENAGLTKIEEYDVPILNNVTVAVKVAELRVELQRILGIPSASRRGLYLKPTEKDLQRIRTRFGLI